MFRGKIWYQCSNSAGSAGWPGGAFIKGLLPEGTNISVQLEIDNTFEVKKNLYTFSGGENCMMPINSK